MLPAHRQALELQRREAAVDVVRQLVRHTRQQALAERGARRVQPARVALRGVVGEVPVRADDAAVRTLPIQVRVAGQRHDRVLIGMRELGVRRVAILREIAPVDAGVGGEENRAAVRDAAELPVSRTSRADTPRPGNPPGYRRRCRTSTDVVQ